MNVKPDEETTTALARLARSAEWAKVEQWLAANREGFVKLSLIADDTKSRQAQGSLMAIDEFIRHTRAAEESSSRR